MGVAPDSIKKGGWEDLESEPEVVTAPVAEVDEIEVLTEIIPT